MLNWGAPVLRSKPGSLSWAERHGPEQVSHLGVSEGLGE